MPWKTNSGDNPSTQPYKYNGKEFVEMHGLDEYDSKARWYYPAIMRTSTMDPLAEKYYNISPYAWCGNNPVKFVDPDGREIWVIYNDGSDKRQQLQYKEGNLYDSKGKIYNGDNNTALTFLEALNNLKSTKHDDRFVSKVIGVLEESDKKHYIEKGKNNQNYSYPKSIDENNLANQGISSGSQTVTTLNDYRIIEGVKSSKEADLGHELRHAYDRDQGLYKGEKLGDRSTADKLYEQRAVGFENRIRKAHGIMIRTTYNEQPIKSYPYAK